MKIKDVAHNHSLTDLLKVGIFSIIMLAPMINVGVRSAYVICNKNAYQSYYGETINETTYENITYTDLQINETYIFNSSTGITVTDTSVKTTLNVSNVENLLQDNRDYSNVNKLEFFMYPSTNAVNCVLYMKNGNNNLQDLNINTVTVAFRFNLISIQNESTLQYINCFYKENHNKYSYLDNVFEYSVNSLNDSQLFNWVTNTGIYTGINTMNTQLGINQPVIALLLSYWLLLTVIYIIIDIVIRVFTWLTHMIGSKTA